MVEFAKPSPIYLTDQHIETAAVLAIFLDLLHGKRLPLPKDLATRRIRELPRVYDLAIKYDCPFVLRQLHLNLRSSLFDGTLNPFFTFTLLSQFKDVEGCAEAIRRNGHAPFIIPLGDENLARRDLSGGWASGSASPSAPAPTSASVSKKDKLLKPTYHMGWADPTCWDIKNASRVDFRFHMALVRAFQRSGACHPLSKLDLEEITVEFQTILRGKYPEIIDSRATTPSPDVSPLKWDLIHPETTPPDIHAQPPIKRLSFRGMRRSLGRALTSVHEAPKI